MRLVSILESLIFAADRPLATKQMRQLTGASAKELKEALRELQQMYRPPSGIELVEIGGGFQFRTLPDNAKWVRKLLAGRPARLTRPMLETLAIIAYRQPVTRPEIEDIRGVDCGGTLRVLLERNVIRIVGKKEEPGRPLLYGTTKTFLEAFQLTSLKDLPSLKEFVELSEEHLRQVEETFGGGPDLVIDQDELDGADAAPDDAVVDAEGAPDADVDAAVEEPAAELDADDEAEEPAAELDADAAVEEPAAEPAPEAEEELAAAPEAGVSAELDADSGAGTQGIAAAPVPFVVAPAPGPVAPARAAAEDEDADEDDEEAADAALEALDRAVARVEATLRAGSELLARPKAPGAEGDDASAPPVDGDAAPPDADHDAPASAEPAPEATAPEPVPPEVAAPAADAAAASDASVPDTAER